MMLYKVNYMKLEEIYKRLKYKPKVEEVEDDSEFFYGEEEKDWEWKPKRYEGDCKAPNFEIKIPNSRNGLYTTKEQLSKVLTFIDTIKKKRLKNGITIIPIATTSKRNIYIWGGKQNVSNAIEYMKKIGLLVEYDSDYKYWGYKDEDNYPKTYLYFVDNEKKLIKYCEDNNITKYIPKHQKDIKIKKVKLDIIEKNKTFKEEDVIFKSKMELHKPAGVSKTDFEKYILYCLYKNHPYLGLVQNKVDEMNEKYYKNYPDFQIRFIPNIHWNEDENIIIGIGIRGTNSFCNKKRRKRYWIKKEYGFVLEKDIKSSVPRLTLSINKGEWVDEDVDIYELINSEFEPGKKFTNERRKAIKELHMSMYFDDSSDKKTSGNVLYRMKNKDGVVKEELDEVITKLRKAVLKAEGGKTYGSEIFYVESCVYLMTLYDLLSAGIMTWFVYDCFYSIDFEDKEFFENMILNQVKYNFNDFMKYSKSYLERN